MKKRKERLLLILIVLGIIPFLVPIKKKDQLAESKVATESFAAMPPASQTPSATVSLADIKSIDKEPVLADAQKSLLDELTGYMISNQYQEAAQLLQDNENQLRVMMENTFNDQLYLYNENGLSKVLNGKGIVLSKKNVVFYGEFLSGQPEGYVTALQALFLDQPRYDFSRGQWRAGVMEGSGEIGYETYGNDDNEIADYSTVVRRGNFIKDVMDGEVVYNTNIDQNLYTWLLTVVNGQIQPEDSWEFIAEENKYRLPSLEDPRHVYVINADMIDKIKWKNMIIWNK